MLATSNRTLRSHTMMKQHREKNQMETLRRLLFRHVRLRQAILFSIALSACLVMTYTVHVLRSRPLVIKLHNSAERFIAESLHEIVLLPDKLDPAKMEELSLEQKCALQQALKKKRKGASKQNSTQDRDKTAEERREEMQQEEERAMAEDSDEKQQEKDGSKHKDEKSGSRRSDLSVEDIWPARRRDWKENVEFQRVSRLMASHSVFRRNIDLINMKIPKRLLNFKTPCYLVTPHDLTQCRAGSFKVWEKFAKGHNQNSVDKKKTGLSCLPYFIVAGTPQGGAIDLLQLLSRHPEVTVPLPVQSKWLESVRFEESCGSLNAYLDFLAPTTKTINASITKQGYHSLVAGEAAEDILWNNSLWPVLPGNEEQLEPRYINADYLRHFNPNVKIIVILRDPTERLYDEYLADSERLEFVPSADDFNTRVTYGLDVLRTCLRSEPLRTCVYDTAQETPDKAVRIRSGMYHVMLQDWLRVFPRKQVHVVNYETFFAHMKTELDKLIKFLNIRAVSATEMEKMVKLTREKRQKRVNRTRGMLTETRSQLDNFYRPLNKFLATLLQDQSFMWGQ